MTTPERVGRVEDFEEKTANRLEIDGRAVCLVRVGETFYALDDTCSHEDYSLSEGEVDVGECAIECWKHGSLFSLTTGEPLTFPATRPVAVHKVRVVEGEVEVTLSLEEGGS